MDTNQENTNPLGQQPQQVPPVPNPDSGFASSPAAPSQQPNLGVPSTPPPSPSSPMTNPQEVQTPVSSGGGKKRLGILLAVLLVLVVAFLGILYFQVMRQPATPEPQQQLPVVETQTPTEAPSPTQAPLTEESVESVDLGSPETELKPVTSELNQL